MNSKGDSGIRSFQAIAITDSLTAFMKCLL
jgi:hypothetical protein